MYLNLNLNLKAVCLPCWSAAAKLLALVQPSSAAPERVFSLLKVAYSDLQGSYPEDYLEAAVMLAYNYRTQAENRYPDLKWEH